MSSQLFTLKKIQAERNRIIEERDSALRHLSLIADTCPPQAWRAFARAANELPLEKLRELDIRFEVAQEWMSKQKALQDENTALKEKFQRLLDIVNSGDAPAIGNLRPALNLVDDYYMRIYNEITAEVAK